MGLFNSIHDENHDALMNDLVWIGEVEPGLDLDFEFAKPLIVVGR